MAANPMNNKNLGRTHSKELAKNNRGKRTRKNSDYQTAATAARQAQAQSQAARKAPWPTKVKVTLGIMFGVLVACLVVRLAVPSLQENQILNSATTLLLGLSCGALYLIRKDYPAPKPSKLDGVVNAVLIVFALVYGLLASGAFCSCSRKIVPPCPASVPGISR